jgi:hypothetical protein
MTAHRTESCKPRQWHCDPAGIRARGVVVATSVFYADFDGKFENNYPAAALNQPRQKWVP